MVLWPKDCPDHRIRYCEMVRYEKHILKVVGFMEIPQLCKREPSAFFFQLLSRYE